MRRASVLSVCGLVAVVLSFAAEPGREKAKPTLWDSEYSTLFPAIRQFVAAPATKSDKTFVAVEKDKKGVVRFKNVPNGWFTWQDKESKGRVIVLDEDGFRILIRLEHVRNITTELKNHIQYGHGHRDVVLIDHTYGDQVPRVVKCAKYKLDTNVMEYRYFETEEGAVCVELTVFDEPEKKRTLDHLLAHLRAHYGKYEGVCQQVADLVAEKR